MTNVQEKLKNWHDLHTALEDVQDELILPEACENSDPSWFFGFLISVRAETGLDRDEITRYIVSALNLGV